MGCQTQCSEHRGQQGADARWMLRRLWGLRGVFSLIPGWDPRRPEQRRAELIPPGSWKHFLHLTSRSAVLLPHLHPFPVVWAGAPAS